MKRKKMIVVAISFALVMSSAASAFATHNQIPSFNGLEIIDEVETELVENWNYNEIQRDKIIEDIEALDYLGIDIKSIESIEFKGEKNAVYNIAVNEDITDTIIINQGVNGITMEVFEDGKHDILLVKEDGTMYLDGKKVTVEEDTISNSYIPENDAVALSEVGGVQWYKSSAAPSKLKNASYKSFSKYPDWTCTSVNFHKSLKAIAYSTAVGILSGVSKGLLGIVVNGALGFFSSTLYELANYDGNSQCISFKYYIVRGKTNNRYLKLKRITWPRKNYKPNNKSVITYEYGQVI